MKRGGHPSGESAGSVNGREPLSSLWSPRWRAVLVVFAVLFYAYLVLPRTNVYSIVANTEIVSFSIADPDGVTSSLIGRAEILGPVHVRGISNARLYLERGATVIAKRNSKGPLVLEFTAPQDAVIASRILLPDSSEFALSSDSVIRIYLDEMDSKFMLAFDGLVTIGAQLGPRVDSMLLSATIAIWEKQPVFGQRFLLDKRAIEPGSVVKFEYRNPTQIKRHHASVLLRVDTRHSQLRDKDAIQVLATSDADKVKISSFGSSDYSIEPSVWSRIGTDPIAQMILTALVISASLTTILGYFEHTIGSRESSSKAHDLDTE